MTLSAILSAGTVYLLTIMGGFPFAVWSGRAAYAGTIASAGEGGPARPGRAAMVFSVVLPALFIVYYIWAGLGTPSAAGPGAFDPLAEQPDGGVQLMFFLLPPCFGLIAGYGSGWYLAARKR